MTTAKEVARRGPYYAVECDFIGAAGIHHGLKHPTRFVYAIFHDDGRLIFRAQTAKHMGELLDRLVTVQDVRTRTLYLDAA